MCKPQGQSPTNDVRETWICPISFLLKSFLAFVNAVGLFGLDGDICFQSSYFVAVALLSCPEHSVF